MIGYFVYRRPAASNYDNYNKAGGRLNIVMEKLAEIPYIYTFDFRCEGKAISSSHNCVYIPNIITEVVSISIYTFIRVWSALK